MGRSMTNVMNIAGRQLRAYFDSALAYITIAVVLAFVGGFFWQYFFLINRVAVRDMFLWLARAMLFAAPALTMGLLAEERRSGTLELLITMPVREWEVIVGKFLGAYALFAILVAVTVVHPIAVWSLGDLDLGPVVSGYFGILLLGAAMLAIGVMASSVTKSQPIAFFLSFVLLLALYLVPLAFRMLMQGTLAGIASTVSLEEQLEFMSRGVVDLRGVVYFLTLTTIGLMTAFRALESRRWS
jgi:ABC-2 type transport system permease protein